MSSVLQSTEFRLVAACCRPRSLPDFVALIEARAATPFDVDRVLTLARRHRVEGFVEDGLGRARVTLPDAAAHVLNSRARQSRQQMLRNAAEEVRIERLLRAAGLAPVFVKGASLAMLAHGSLAQKTAWDIDLLIEPGALADARRVLTDAGYRLELPDIIEPAQIETFFRRNKETLWLNAARDTALELHTALVETPTMLAGVRSPWSVQTVQIGSGATITTLARPQLAAYLCVHGTGHCWARLKWLTDVAALVAQSNAPDFFASATHLGAASSAATALRLCAEVLDMPDAARAANDSATTRWLCAASLKTLGKGGDLEAAQATTIGDAVRALAAKIVLIPRLAARIGAIGTLLDTSYTADRLAVPDALLRLHALVWAPRRLLTRHWRHRQARDGKAASKP